jgi:ligand-binding sensor domain-containing protein
MKYSRNLGTGNGIELIKLFKEDISLTSPLTTSNSELPSNVIKSIYVDNSNTIWIGTDAGLSRLKGDEWLHYNKTNQLKSNVVNDIAYMATNQLYIATDSGLTVATYTTNGISSANTHLTSNSSILGNKVKAVAVDKNNKVWIGSDKGLNLLYNNNWLSVQTASGADGFNFNFTEYPITDVTEYEPDNQTFISTKGKGIIRMQHNDVDGFTGASTFGMPWASINSDNITSMSMMGATQWIGTDVGMYKHANNETKSDWELYDTDANLIDNYINTVFVDSKSNIWIGTNKGLNVLKTNGNILKYTENEGLIKNSVISFAEDLTGNVWVGTTGGVHWFSEPPGVIVSSYMPQIAQKQLAKIFPNPVENYMNIFFNTDKAQVIKGTLFTLNGQKTGVLFNQYITSVNQTLSVNISHNPQMKKGMYILKLEGEDINQTIRFVVK